jgi:hypothetical protein
VVDKDAYTFLASINNENEMYKVIRGHLFIESKMIKLLGYILPFPEAINLDRMNFSTKIDICTATGILRKDEMDCYKKFNLLRNSIAHNLEKELNEQEVSNIVSRFPSHLELLYNTMYKDPNFSRLSIMIATLFVNLGARNNLSKTINPEKFVSVVQNMNKDHFPKELAEKRQ